MFRSSRLRRGAAAAVVVVAMAAGGGAALAHSSAGGGASGWVAGVLGALVADGTISDSQADAVAQALAEGRPEGPHEGHGPWGHHRAGLAGLDAAAEAIGIEAAELTAALRSGATIAQQAEANGVAVADVVAAMVAAAESAITQAEEAGRIDAAKAAGLRDGLAERVAGLVERPGRGMAHRPHTIPEA